MWQTDRHTMWTVVYKVLNKQHKNGKAHLKHKLYLKRGHSLLILMWYSFVSNMPYHSVWLFLFNAFQVLQRIQD